ncbi:dihydrofolate reductase [Candidatus Parcubacteria bacterium]|uniref:Dihydrofolate reductase n=1 Tax=Candidatus Kaiserbacteria bacterium CG10_big_fil_rev_8_21_14_0_10_47_16 TaxID=1974608 RepID=A0A2H0UEN7_9BACT|nr:dihydrofolate reductase [Candidatus Parcubacteria bacterium]PIR84879.1 MAG: diacylglycerol kinase [Candidatus Kaiserbacteria bacterium CG10_big_fil_rev_8_21_14_0_10_47_16]
MNEKTNKAKVCIVVAVSKEKHAIGNGDKLLWHIPEDMKRFKTLTLGHPVIMGRKTFESILGYLGKPLPDRTNIVVTRDESYTHEGVEVCTSLESALALAHELDSEEIHIGGGAEIYRQVLPFIDRLYLTIVDDEPNADTFFPDYSEFTKVIETEKRDHDGLTYTWLTLERE